MPGIHGVFVTVNRFKRKEVVREPSASMLCCWRKGSELVRAAFVRLRGR